jgi:valyl-tRNA synthetase
MQSNWPEIDSSLIDQAAVSNIERAFHITRELRALRAELGLAALKPVEVAYVEGDVQGIESILTSQAWIQDLRPGKPHGKFISATIEGIDVHLPFGPEFDLEKELARLAKDEERTTSDIQRLSARLSNPAFVEKANPEVIAKDEAHLMELRRKLEKIEERRQLFQS